MADDDRPGSELEDVTYCREGPPFNGRVNWINICPAWPRLWNTIWYKRGSYSVPCLVLPCSGGEDVTSCGRECATFAIHTNTFRDLFFNRTWSWSGKFKSVGDFLWFTEWIGPFYFHPGPGSAAAEGCLAPLCSKFFTPSNIIMAIGVTIFKCFS